MNILHTESSNGWGGQEIRILKESLGLRKRGHQIVFAVVKGGKLAHYARNEGFIVYEIDFRKSRGLSAIKALQSIIRDHQIEVVNTHSSADSWLAGIAGRLSRCKIVRTRHLSTPVRGWLNSRLLYRGLADFIVTTSSVAVSQISRQAGLPLSRFQCVPTGVEPFEVVAEERQAFRDKMGVKAGDILIGTVCVVRSWKGVQDLIGAARLLKHHPHLKWVVIGGGYIHHFRHLVNDTMPFTFTGHLESPSAATSGLDIFALLSTAHEGISQASLQAAYLHKPLITTPVGGLPEVCIDGVTGIQVPVGSPEKIAKAVLRLAADPQLRKSYGAAAHDLVKNKFMFDTMLDQMEQIFNDV